MNNPGYEGFYEDVRQFKPLTEWQLWRKIDGHWFLQVDAKEKILQAVQKKLYRGDRWSVEADGQVRIGEQIKIPFFNQAQLGTLTIRNGTREPIRIVDVKLDGALFRISESPGEIPAQQKRHLEIVHLGPDELKNQKSSLTLVIEQEGQEQEYRSRFFTITSRRACAVSWASRRSRQLLSREQIRSVPT